ncbi:hypothetical protein RBG61_13070 [Paludicola sp. MB14-C6]|uniref:hypothetical protein n=1 Tax=Paludihabitans sp. MB14-C6 TaxID=3070656 RepID=UPI0027DE37EA|nr:hypothetical protein [Paludicola sp. MB14-C6]WMJ22905.1 hypothetical protein RBG61_13070 [Paludicola sp. MB14-C6]
MEKIKVKNKQNDIKVLDRAAQLSQHMKHATYKTKKSMDKDSSATDGSPNDYATNTTITKMNELTKISVDKFSQNGRVLSQRVYNDLKMKRNTINSLHKSLRPTLQPTKNIKTSTKGTIKTAQKSIKNTKTVIKNTKQATKATYKTAQTVIKTSQKTVQVAKVTGKAIVTTAKVAMKAIVAAVKATVATVKGIVALIAAGGWVAVVVIVLLCVVALMVGSLFGMDNSNIDNPNPMTGAISEINKEYDQKIEQIIADNSYDEVKVNSDNDMYGIQWDEVLANYFEKLYSLRNYDNDNADALEVNEDLLREIVWEMNEITYSVEIVKNETEVIVLTIYLVHINA